MNAKNCKAELLNVLGTIFEKDVELDIQKKCPAEMEQADSMPDLFAQLQLTTLPQDRRHSS